MLTGHLWTGLSAVHDSVAAVERERVLQLGQTLLCEIISRVDHPAIRLRGKRMQHLSAAPLMQFYDDSCGRLPASGQRGQGTYLRSTSNWGSWCCSRRTGYTRTGRPAADQIISRTRSQQQNSTAMKTELYQLLSVLHGLQVLLLPFIGLVLLLQVGLNWLVLGIEVTHVLQTQTIQSALWHWCRCSHCVYAVKYWTMFLVIEPTSDRYPD